MPDLHIYFITPPPKPMFGQMDLQDQSTVSSIFWARILSFIVKNCGINTSLSEFECDYVFIMLVQKIFFYCIYFFWNFKHVNLEGKRTDWSIFFAWVLCCYLKNRGVNFLLNGWTSFFCLLLLFFFAVGTAVVWLHLSSVKLQLIMRFFFKLFKSYTVIK